MAFSKTPSFPNSQNTDLRTPNQIPKNEMNTYEYTRKQISPESDISRYRYLYNVKSRWDVSVFSGSVASKQKALHSNFVLVDALENT